MSSCLVINCKSRFGDKSVSFSRLPTARHFKSEALTELIRSRREKWILALKRKLSESQLKHGRICSKHFISGKPAAFYDSKHPDWVPNQNMGYSGGVLLKKPSALMRYERAKERVKRREETLLDIALEGTNTQENLHQHKSLAMADIEITGIDVQDIRFPTSLLSDGSDAMHTDPDYSCAYVTIKTNKKYQGYGLTFTLGRGTEIVVQACIAMSKILKGVKTKDIFSNFASYWRKITSETQIRWIGPEKGVTHLATAAIINALWDLWARIEGKPLWKLLVDLSPEELVSTIDFRYITDVITEEEAVKILKEKQVDKEKREEFLLQHGYPAYTTQVGWLGYSDEKVRQLCKKYLSQGFTAFKAKVGQNLEDDLRRCRVIREEIGNTNKLMVDANQVWDVRQAIEWMKNLKEFNLTWIEEPTSPDDIIGHATIAKELRPFGIGVATGEMCANRVMFKQFLQTRAIDFCQIDSARIGGVNEILSVYLMAYKMNVPVCPHAGGVGLCEMVQHLQFWDMISLSGTMKDRMIEYVDQQHEHFENPTVVKNAHYMPPKTPGYSTKFKKDSIINYVYPEGKEWQRMFKEGIFQSPDN